VLVRGPDLNGFVRMLGGFLGRDLGQFFSTTAKLAVW
jgi:hypothetical protein